MDPASFGFAVFATAATCVTLCKSLCDKYRSYRGAERSLIHLVLTLEGLSIKIDYQFAVLRGIWEELPDRYQIHQNHVLQVFHGHLRKAVDAVESLLDKTTLDSLEQLHRSQGRVRKLKYTIFESSLKDAAKAVEQWQSLFDPTWYLIARMVTPALDAELDLSQAGGTLHRKAMRQMRVPTQAEKSSVNLRWLRDVHNLSISHETPLAQPTEAVHDARGHLEMSSVRLARSAKGDRILFADSFEVNQARLKVVEPDVRRLALKLKDADPNLGLLKCCGCRKTPLNAENDNDFEMQLVFELPSQFRAPKSLRKSLCSSNRESYSINQRIRFARLLARSVLSIHTAEFVHKNISPESIILVEEKGVEADALTPFLLGFNMFRHKSNESFHLGDAVWQKNLYRHPTRQGIDISEDYVMQHDIYSLGVCLLEMGLWSPFVSYEAAEKPKIGHALESMKLLDPGDNRMKAMKTKDSLVAMARSQLPSSMGKIYTEAVLSCLTCLDKDNDLFGDEDEFSDDKDGIQVGVRFSQEVR